MKTGSYKDLIVWQKSMDLVIEIYNLTSDFPREEIYGLTSQMRRAAVSIPSNLAEGSRRSSRKDFCHFVYTAFGSGAELETQAEISKRLKFGKDEKYQKVDGLLIEIMKMSSKLIDGLEQNQEPYKL